MIEIARFYDPEEAKVAAGFLRAQGLEIELTNAHFLNANPELRIGLGGFGLMGSERDAIIAKRLLAEIEHKDKAAAPRCPVCQSDRIAKKRDLRFPLFHALLCIIFPFAPPTGEKLCRDCDHVWRPEEEDASAHEPV